MFRIIAPVAVVALTFAFHGAALAQALIGAQQPGARAGNSYVPSTHTPGCGGALCDATDPQLMAGPPPPCQGFICGMSPYSMQPPVTAAEAARLQQERARAQAAAAASAPPPAAEKTRRHRTVKRVAVKTTPAKTAARTPDPTAAAAPNR